MGEGYIGTTFHRIEGDKGEKLLFPDIFFQIGNLVDIKLAETRVQAFVFKSIIRFGKNILM